MAGGTFTFRVGSISARSATPGGGWYVHTIAGDTYSALEADIIASIRAGAPGTNLVILSEENIPPNPNATHTSVGGTAVLTFDMDTTTIVLVGDAGGTYSFSGLPAGFTISTAQLNTNENAQSGSTSIKRNASTILSVSPDNGGSHSIALGAPLDPLSVINDVYGFNFTTIAGWMPPVTASITSLNITGTYLLPSTSWTLPGGTIKAGDKVPLITTAPPLAIGVTGISIQYGSHTINVPAQDFIDQSPSQITFYMPEFGNHNGPVNIFVIGNGVQFSGSVFLGTLTVLFVDASGIYTLTPLKPTDTIYSGARDGTTVDVAIQDPTIETAFIP